MLFLAVFYQPGGGGGGYFLKIPCAWVGGVVGGVSDPQNGKVQ